MHQAGFLRIRRSELPPSVAADSDQNCEATHDHTSWPDYRRGLLSWDNHSCLLRCPEWLKVASELREGRLPAGGALPLSFDQNLRLLTKEVQNVWSKGIWLGLSPDLSPIEHTWAMLQGSALETSPSWNRKESITWLNKKWNLIPLAPLKSIIDSFLRDRGQSCCWWKNDKNTDVAITETSMTSFGLVV